MIRPRFALPFGIDLSDYEFDEAESKPPKRTHRGTRGSRNRPSRRRPDRVNLQRKAEYRLRVLNLKRQQWDEQYYRIRAAQIAADIDADKAWLKDYAERHVANERAESEMARVRDWYKQELAKEAARVRRT
jgi:hypothetical protein